ncbi:hypothetical protein [Occallatibacter riparius]|uniref:Uncharacterized protein n=1 Tax=Occallatibacter riparius TaxID=1002689 RepID=A0A9J7BHL3_9BACT|nr:hypothetical protein [Occallatibacter riparius]UWZ82001.1 hypothetical protein MOP44_15625 [Occallatibacter riparius]
MKRWHVIALVLVLAGVGAYFYFYRGFRLGAGGLSGAGNEVAGSAQMSWQTISRPDDGFKVELPADPKETQIPAYNELGGTEPVRMLYASPDADTMFALAWSDNPPVARVNHRAPDLTLDQARDGMLARTQTTLASESKTVDQGFPARDITAKNSGGGLLQARFVLVNDRLYTLMALFPSTKARHEQDVVRFYNSFSPSGISTTLPSAPPKG